MSEREHALLSASSAHRWLACPLSARLEETMPDTESESAKEGTLAHAIAELKVRSLFVEPIPKRTFNAEMKKLKKDELYQKEMDRFTDEYAEFIKEVALSCEEKPFVAVEKRVDYSTYAPEGFGTADCILISGGDLHVIDFKYGKNVSVSAEDNPQLKLYALGVLTEYAMFFQIETAHLHIFQPRAYEESIRYSQMAVSELLAWGESIKETAQLAFEGEGEQQTGEHCKFCRVKGFCREQAVKHLELETYGFRLPPVLLPEEVGEVLYKAKDLEAWVKSIKDWALAQLLSGFEVPGWKAVNGKSQRVWSDQEKAFKALTDGGIAEEILFERKPLTLAQIEKEVGKKELTAMVGDLIVKAPGKPTLAEETDKREAITGLTQAQEDFKNE